jgi:hypothetical protein
MTERQRMRAEAMAEAGLAILLKGMRDSVKTAIALAAVMQWPDVESELIAIRTALDRARSYQKAHEEAEEENE